MVYRRVGVIAVAGVLLFATGAYAQQQSHQGSQQSQHRSDELSGTVATIDTQRSHIVFTDGRAFSVRQDTVILADGREITFTTVKSGQVIVVRNAWLVSSQQPSRVIRAPEPQQMVVQGPASSTKVQVPQRKVTVEPQAPEIVVRSEAPEVVVESMPAARMTVEGTTSSLSMTGKLSTESTDGVNTIVVPLPAARMHVSVPRDRVVVQPPAPEIVLQSRPLEVAVQPSPQPRLSMQASAERQAEVSALPHAAVSGQASATTEDDGSMMVRPYAEQMTVEIPRQRILVRPSAPDVVVHNPAPEVTIRPTPAPKLIYEGRGFAAGSTLDQSTFSGQTLTVQPPSQRVVVQVPRTVVVIQPAAPEIVLNAQPPEVLVKESPEPKLVMGDEPKPQVAAVEPAPEPAAAVPLREVVPITGIVERTDPDKGLIVLRDHNAVKLGPDVRFSIDGRPVVFHDIKPGMLVSIYADPDAWRRHSPYAPDVHVIEHSRGTAASTIWEPIYTPGEATPRHWELGRQTP